MQKKRKRTRNGYSGNFQTLKRLLIVSGKQALQATKEKPTWEFTCRTNRTITPRADPIHDKREATMERYDNLTFQVAREGLVARDAEIERLKDQVSELQTI